MGFTGPFTFVTMTMLVPSEVVDECIDQQEGQQDGTSDAEPLDMIVATVGCFREGRGKPFAW